MDVLYIKMQKHVYNGQHKKCSPFKIAEELYPILSIITLYIVSRAPIDYDAWYLKGDAYYRISKYGAARALKNISSFN